jgi:hypothetical protein
LLVRFELFLVAFRFVRSNHQGRHLKTVFDRGPPRSGDCFVSNQIFFKAGRPSLRTTPRAPFREQGKANRGTQTMETLNKVDAETVFHLPLLTSPLVVLRGGPKTNLGGAPSDLTVSSPIENRLPVNDTFSWDTNQPAEVFKCRPF